MYITHFRSPHITQVPTRPPKTKKKMVFIFLHFQLVSNFMVEKFSIYVLVNFKFDTEHDK